ncbi:SRPBCC family protein [Saccharospirillum salsuginis]|uniref:Activator of Hsp90 ATPase homologue 1/2-like C-terminal domain-containing protein n=1 Tax=Saccharospirillum salsuginis TaxID=418750 RepID=A0A918N7G1_9GAMM|nr:SRPBCC domain-containing protein [Saccharospirillum salsuginis]GGX43224.1 hypothetical protein GCM10007392_07410 [Saccharospirillum salsuginis]
MNAPSLNLIARRIIQARPSQVFHAWTSPEALKVWWGPAGVDCPAAEVNLVEGGEYRIANQLPEGNLLWITGTFEEIVPNEKLVYTWLSSDHQKMPERVSVYFKPVTEGTEVIVVHERIMDKRTVEQHKAGWEGCLEGLVQFYSGPLRRNPS